MADRKYSVVEIDRMRAAIKKKNGKWYPEHIPYICDNPSGMGNFHMASWARAAIDNADQRCEEELRTHMLNGTEPEELER